ncbi:hypothetical protein KCP69_17200 [Salmonella enterica subsp. enterica]|nr:hypothetical protein KCP69_17200 [Salmonella enterica subsp. enterica]
MPTVAYWRWYASLSRVNNKEVNWGQRRSTSVTFYLLRARRRRVSPCKIL